MTDGISRATFMTGIAIAIIAASLLSTAVSMQLALVQGPKGDKGDTGLQGSAGILTPDYDSGWVVVGSQVNIEFNHSLGTSDVFVYVICKWHRNWTGSGGPMVHQFYYGVDWHGDPEQMQGFYWYCYTENPNMIQVSQYGGRADELRVLIWKLPEP